MLFGEFNVSKVQNLEIRQIFQLSFLTFKPSSVEAQIQTPFRSPSILRLSPKHA